MPRFHFHFREKDECCRDQDGIEYASAEEAYLAAYHGAVDMWSELLKERRDPRQCAFEVTNEKDQVLFILPFMEALDACGRGNTRLGPLGSNLYLSAVQARRRAHESFKELKREMKVTRKNLTEARKLILEVDRLTGDE